MGSAMVLTFLKLRTENECWVSGAGLQGSTRYSIEKSLVRVTYGNASLLGSFERY